MPTEALLLDFDGTVLNSSRHDAAPTKRFFEVAAGLALPVNDENKRKAAEMWGKYGPKATVSACWPEQDFEVFIREWCRIDMDPALMPPLIHGAKEALYCLKRENIFLGILTDRDIVSTRCIMHAYDIWRLFDLVWTRDDLPEGGKSNPLGAKKVVEEITRRGMGKSGILLVGDSKTDFDCARAAGFPFVGVLSGFATKSDFISFGLPENLIISSIVALPALLRNITLM